MKILITGGYGFIGSHIADRFYREGHEIYIIDNLTNGKKENFIHSHRFYELDVEDPNCEEIFKGNKFDVVVHMAAKVGDSMLESDAYSIAKSNLLGLVNILNLSRKYEVNKFIFASSTSVYGDSKAPLNEEDETNPLTLLAFNKLLGEKYTNLYAKRFVMDTVCIRLSNVYGPRQRAENGGVVSKFIEDNLNHRPMVIHGSGKQVRDFIYIEDVVDAVYKVFSIKYSGVFNLCSGVSTQIKDIAELVALNDKSGDIDYDLVVYDDQVIEPVHSIQVDNTKAKKIFDWIPTVSLEEGITKTYLAYYNVPISIAKSKEDIKQKLRNARAKFGGFFNKVNERRWMPYIENIGAYILLTLLSVMFFGVFRHSPVDFNLMLIVVFSIMYGSKQGAVSFVLSFISTIILFAATSRDPVVLIYSTDFYLKLASYVFVAFMIGYIRDELVRVNQDNIKVIGNLDEKVDFVTTLYHDMRLVRDELQTQIIHSEDSFGKIFSILQELDTLKPEEVFAKAVNVLERLMKTDSVAIYRLSGGGKYARLMSCSVRLNNLVSKSINVEEHQEVISTIANRDLYVAKQIVKDAPILAMPVISNNDVVGVVLIYKTDFDMLTLSYQNYFKVITDLISSTLYKAYEYDKAVSSERYIEGTSIYTRRAFEEVLSSKQYLMKNSNLQFICLKVNLDEYSLRSAAQKIDNVIRDDDFMGMDDMGQLYVILSNTNRKEAQFVVRRLSKIGISVQMVEFQDKKDND